MTLSFKTFKSLMSNNKMDVPRPHQIPAIIQSLTGQIAHAVHRAHATVSDKGMHATDMVLDRLMHSGPLAYAGTRMHGAFDKVLHAGIGKGSVANKAANKGTALANKVSGLTLDSKAAHMIANRGVGLLDTAGKFTTGSRAARGAANAGFKGMNGASKRTFDSGFARSVADKGEHAMDAVLGRTVHAKAAKAVADRMVHYLDRSMHAIGAANPKP